MGERHLGEGEPWHNFDFALHSLLSLPLPAAFICGYYTDPYADADLDLVLVLYPSPISFAHITFYCSRGIRS